MATFFCPLNAAFTVTRSCNNVGEWQAFNEEGCGVVSSQLDSLKDTFDNVSIADWVNSKVKPFMGN